MESLIPITLFGWIVVAIMLFAALPPRRAVLTAYIAAWLFLPQAGIEVVGLPDLTKVTSAGLGVLLGVLLFDAGRLNTYRFSWVDLPMAVWCLSSIPSSLLNDLGWYDGFSGVLRDFFTWGIPYFVGRLYFTDLESLRDLAVAVFAGGLVYVPFCLWEIRMSPQLHRWVYGFHPAHFAMSVRFGGYRPMVFMQHGLMVGMWMTSAALAGFWLWWTGALSRFRNVPVWLLLGGLAMTTIMCKSTGAIALLIMGAGVLMVNTFFRSNLILAALLFIAPAYIMVRTQGWWDGRQLVEFAAKIDEERAESIAGRLRDEEILMERSSLKPIYGWGGWGRWRVKDDETGKDLTSSDGMWIIVRGEKGVIGVASNTLIVLLPFLLLLRRVPARQWPNPMFAPAAVLATLLLLWSIDNLFNAMMNPVYVMAAGGLSGLYLGYPALMARYRALQQHSLMQRVRIMQALQQRQSAKPDAAAAADA